MTLPLAPTRRALLAALSLIAAAAAAGTTVCDAQSSSPALAAPVTIGPYTVRVPAGFTLLSDKRYPSHGRVVIWIAPERGDMQRAAITAALVPNDADPAGPTPAEATALAQRIQAHFRKINPGFTIGPLQASAGGSMTLERWTTRGVRAFSSGRALEHGYDYLYTRPGHPSCYINTLNNDAYSTTIQPVLTAACQSVRFVGAAR